LSIAGRSFAITITVVPFGKFSIGLPISSSTSCNVIVGSRRDLEDYNMSIKKLYTLHRAKRENPDGDRSALRISRGAFFTIVTNNFLQIYCSTIYLWFYFRCNRAFVAMFCRLCFTFSSIIQKIIIIFENNVH